MMDSIDSSERNAPVPTSTQGEPAVSHGSQTPGQHGQGIPPYSSTVPPYGPPAKKRETLLIIPAVIAFIAFVILPIAFAVFSLNSCMSQCKVRYSDPPIHESAETKTFLQDIKANDDDLRVFDAIRPAIEKKTRARIRGEAHGNLPSDDDVQKAVDEIRVSVKDGQWSLGVDDSSPLLWVRICELAERELSDRTSETWHVVDFGYPSPNNGSIPIPAHQKSGSVVAMRMRCMTGRYEGLIVGINYYRWAEQPYFVSYASEACQRFEQMQQGIEQLQTLLPDNNFVCSYGNLFDFRGCEEKGEKHGYILHIWENEDEQVLSDIDQFTAKAQQIFDDIPNVEKIITLSCNHDSDVDIVQIQNFEVEDTATVQPELPHVQGISETQNLCLYNHYVYLSPHESSEADACQLEVDRSALGDDGQISLESLGGTRVGIVNTEGETS